MQTHCTEDSKFGQVVELEFIVQSQSEIDAGARPYFLISLDTDGEFSSYKIPLLHPLIRHYLGDTLGILTVDPLSVFAEGVKTPEDADVVAEWLEDFAQQLRLRFPKS